MVLLTYLVILSSGESESGNTTEVIDQLVRLARKPDLLHLPSQLGEVETGWV